MKERHVQLANLIAKTGDPVEKGRLLVTLRLESGLLNTEISKFLNITSSHATNLMRLTRLPESIIDGYYNGFLKYTHLLLLSRLTDTESMLRVYEKILSEGTNTSELQNIIRFELTGIKDKGKGLSVEDEKKLVEEIKGVHQNNKSIDVKLVQTKTRAQLHVSIKGDKQTTTSFIRSLLKRLA